MSPVELKMSVTMGLFWGKHATLNSTRFEECRGKMCAPTRNFISYAQMSREACRKSVDCSPNSTAISKSPAQASQEMHERKA